MIIFGFGVENVVTSGTLFVVTLFDLSASGSQKKEYSDFGIGCGDDGDALILDDVETFIGGAIRRGLTC